MINITPSTILFSLGSFSVKTWGTIVAIGMIIGILLMLIEAKKRKLYDVSVSLLAYMMILGLVFGRIAYILVNLPEFNTLLSYFAIWNGGIISWGVLLGIIAGAAVFKLISKLKYPDFLRLLDMFSPYLILAIGIGRIGCFLRGCCYGLSSSLPWAVSYAQEVPVHPTQIYHFIADMIIFAILLKLYNKKKKIGLNKLTSKFSFFKKQGTIFLLFLILFAAERFFIDFLRFHPLNEYVYGLSITQWMFSIIFIVAFVILKIKENKKNK